MTNEATTKRRNKKRMGIIAIVLCCALVAGVAFALFQANKTANVQLITVGDLDLSLVDSEYMEIEDDLEFSGFEGETTAVIYDDSTLTLETFYLYNESDIDVTYTISITEPTTTSDGANIITWSTTVGDAAYSSTTTYTVEAGEYSDPIVVSGVAGDDIMDYAGESLTDDMVITVTATQAE